VSPRRALLACLVAAVAVACGGGSSTVSPSTELPSIVHVFSSSFTSTGAASALITMAVHNAATTDDRLESVTCTCSATVRIVEPRTSGGTEPVRSVELPPNEVVLMGPHGPHVTLTNLTPAPAPGSTLTLELHFAHATPTTTVVAVGGS
jgi:copper(I)-binding protein